MREAGNGRSTERSKVRSHEVAHSVVTGGGAHSSPRIRCLDPLTGLVIGYVAAVATFVGMLPMLLKNGW